MLDAPVTGSSPRAEDGTLTIMAGGHAEDFARAKPLLEAMGKLIVHVGELGQGEMLKLINNALGAANAAALAEALLLARATGVDLDAFVEVTSAGSGASAQMQMKSTPMREHDYTTLFKTAHMLKDVRLCLEESQTAGVPFPVGRPCAQPARRHDGARPRRGGLRSHDRGCGGTRRMAIVNAPLPRRINPGRRKMPLFAGDLGFSPGVRIFNGPADVPLAVAQGVANSRFPSGL